MRARRLKRQAPWLHNAKKSLEVSQCTNPLNGATNEMQELDIDGAMHEGSVAISQDLFVCCLQLSGKQKALAEGRELHGFIVQHEFDSSPHVGNLLINFYTKCGIILDARDVFERMVAHDAYAWAMMISGFTVLGHAQNALAFYKQMEIEGTQLDRVTCLAVLKACATAGDLYQGKQMHNFIFTSGINLSVTVGNSLIDMYAKCGDIEHAWQVFDTMPNQDAVSWNIMIAAFARTGQIKEAFSFFNSMEMENFDPDEVTFLSILKACSTVEQGKQVYSYILKKKKKLTTFVGNTLIDLFVKCDSIADACKVFNQMDERDTLTWTMVIAGCARNDPKESDFLFSRMVQECALPNKVTFVTTISSCFFMRQGKQLHAQYLANHFPPNVVVGNTLIDMYARCGSLQSAQSFFEEMAEKDLISWNTLIAGYAASELGEEALDLFWKFLEKHIESDVATYLSVFKACSFVGVLECCHLIHGHLVERNLFIDIYLESAIIDTYAKCWSIMDARHLFDKMAKYDVISWNTIMTASVNCGQSEEALDLFRRMESRGLIPDAASFLSVLRACTSAGFQDQGRVMHALLVESSFDSHVFLSVSLIDFYAKSGSTEDACQVFGAMAECDVVAWNAIIAGHVEHEQFEQALELYKRMKQEEVSADAVTFVSVLKASANLAALDKGLEIHNDAVKVGLDDNVYVGSTLVDMFGKCGNLDGAFVVFQRMQERDLVTWNAMIAGYALVGRCEEALEKYHRMLLEEVDVDPITFVNVLSACSHAGMVYHGYNYFGTFLKASMSSATVDHYACMVDLVGRAGLLQEGLSFVESMPVQPTPVVWTALLGACKFFGEAHLGLLVAESLLELDPNDPSTVLQLSILYYQVG